VLSSEGSDTIDSSQFKNVKANRSIFGSKAHDVQTKCLFVSFDEREQRAQYKDWRAKKVSRDTMSFQFFLPIVSCLLSLEKYILKKQYLRRPVFNNHVEDIVRVCVETFFPGRSTNLIC
jgi:hypothetical protein